jgi:hypothetical protein
MPRDEPPLAHCGGSALNGGQKVTVTLFEQVAIPAWQTQ